jgi:hypothetical protein
MTVRAALAAVLAAAALALACSHPHPHPEGAPKPTGSATPVEPPLDAGAPAAPADAAPEASAVAPDAPVATENPCGGGSGTIGTGDYGTIGGGYGTTGGGCGGGGLRRSPNVPSIKVGDVKPSNDALDKNLLRRFVKRNTNKFLYCYEKDLMVNPKEKGAVALSFTIAPDGQVPSASAKGIDDAVASCVRDVAKMIEYPKPKDGKTVDVKVTFTYAPTSPP